jgi:hypothetical protein
VLQRKNQVLLSFLKVRAIVNGKEIYPLPDSKPVIIPVQANNPRLVITDGYHISRPLKLVYKDLHTYCFKVVCAVSDGQLLGGFIGLAGMYLSGFYTGLILLKVLSFMPLLYLLLFFYLNRKDFFRLVPVLN